MNWLYVVQTNQGDIVFSFNEWTIPDSWNIVGKIKMEQLNEI